MGFMNLMDKRRPQVAAALAAHLATEETVKLVSEAAINPPSVKSQFASAAASAAVSTALGGGMLMMSVPKKFYVVLTTHRLIALNQGPSGKPTSELSGKRLALNFAPARRQRRVSGRRVSS
jgi:hypothetical protein